MLSEPVSAHDKGGDMVMFRFGAGSGSKEVEVGLFENLFSLTLLMKVVLHLFI